MSSVKAGLYILLKIFNKTQKMGKLFSQFIEVSVVTAPLDTQ